MPAAIATALMALAAAPVWAALTCRVTDHGAKGDGTTLDTLAVQRAIDACAGRQNAIVLVPGPASYLIGTVLLKDNVTLHLERGAVLAGSAEYKDYQAIDPFVDGVDAARGATLLGAENAHDIAVTGEGT